MEEYRAEEDIQQLRSEMSANFRRSRSNTKGLFMISLMTILLFMMAMFHTMFDFEPYTGVMWFMLFGILFFVFAILCAFVARGDGTVSIALADDETARRSYYIAMAFIIFGMLTNLGI